MRRHSFFLICEVGQTFPEGHAKKANDSPGKLSRPTSSHAIFRRMTKTERMNRFQAPLQLKLELYCVTHPTQGWTGLTSLRVFERDPLSMTYRGDSKESERVLNNTLTTVNCVLQIMYFILSTSFSQPTVLLDHFEVKLHYCENSLEILT